MVGEQNLEKILKTIKPVLNSGEYVFCTTNNLENINFSNIIMFFKEEEGSTIIIEKAIADNLNLEYSFVMLLLVTITIIYLLM